MGTWQLGDGQLGADNRARGGQLGTEGQSDAEGQLGAKPKFKKNNNFTKIKAYECKYCLLL